MPVELRPAERAFLVDEPSAGKAGYKGMPAAVFLDRDGVLIEDHGYVHRVGDVKVFPGTAAALRRLDGAGFDLFIVTNQSGIGRGYYRIEDYFTVQHHLEAELAKAGVRFRHVFFAPEAPDQPSRGRKPSPQFLFDARDQFQADLACSYFVGDKWIDLECGWNAGVRCSLLVRTGQGQRAEREGRPFAGPAVVVDDLPAAADWILRDRAAMG